MPSGFPDPKQLGYYYALAQIGVEMAAPIGLGWLLDRWLDWFPWLTSTGAILGLALGLIHLVMLVNRPPNDESK